MNQVKLICPDCKAIIEVTNKLEVGDIKECSQCGTEIEIWSVEPLEYGELIEEK